MDSYRDPWIIVCGSHIMWEAEGYNASDRCIGQEASSVSRPGIALVSAWSTVRDSIDLHGREEPLCCGEGKCSSIGV